MKMLLLQGSSSRQNYRREKRKRLGGEVLVAGFCEPPKALSAVLPIYLQGLLQSSDAETREIAAEGLGFLLVRNQGVSGAEFMGSKRQERHQTLAKLQILIC